MRRPFKNINLIQRRIKQETQSIRRLKQLKKSGGLSKKLRRNGK